jgi:signal transduction histidine kinase/DNA-binding response OmpR family regulator
MVVHNTCLREFIELAPSCSETTNLTMALEALSQNDRTLSGLPGQPPQTFYKHLILVDSSQHPIGLVSLHRLLPYLVAAGLVGNQPVSVSAAAIASDLSLRSITPSIIETVTVLSSDLPIDQFIPLLRASAFCHYVLIDDARDAKILGLLDHSRLLLSLAMNLLDSERLPSQEEPQLPAASAEPRQQKPTKQQRQNTRLVRQLLAQKAEMEMQLKSQQKMIDHLIVGQGALKAIEASLDSGFSSAAQLESAFAPNHFQLHLLNPLLGLLERLPLPLMLQTSNGRVLGQNAVWREQVGELLDPGWIRQEAAVFLETSTEDGVSISLETEHSTPSKSSGQADPNFALSPSLCHLGPSPNSCICVCPLKNGQEQVLQFLKIPLGILSVQPIAEPSSPDSVASSSTDQDWQSFSTPKAPSSFRLATLIATGEEDSFQKPMDAGSQSETITATQPLLTHPIPSSAPETLWLVLAQDITEQQQLARELTAKNADLIQLNRLKDEFLACISHELRTPLTAVLGLSSLLKDQTIGEMNQRQMHYAQLIYQSGRHLMAVVNDILDLARMETGQLDLVSEPVDIPTVCQRALNQAKQVRLLDQQAPEANEELNSPQFELEIEPGLDRLVADEQRLRQMLVHLLSNALKFTEANKKVGLKVNRWGGWIAFTVWDQGIGIPSDKQHLIFQKFQQLENPLTRRFEGTGLGLVLTQRFARLHGGDVTFLSKEGEGSQFTILLPPNPPESSAAVANRDETFLASEYLEAPVPLAIPNRSSSRLAQEKHAFPSHDQRLVLMVEVVPQLIEILSNQLTGLGYRVVIARSGTEALEKARRLQPCIIFLNPMLPLLSGWDVLTLLKSSLETRQIPVIVTATKVDEAHTHRGYADGWLSLPVQLKALRQVLQQHILEPKEVEPQSQPTTVLTVLRLNPGIWAGPNLTISADLNQLLHSHRYRVLESDDLEQAELLARVWKPNAVLLDGTLNSPAKYFRQLSQHAFLSSLPLIILDQEATQAANQVPGLLIFPCLATPAAAQTSGGTKTSALLQVIQIAAGYAWRPSVLALDIAKLPESLDESDPQNFINGSLGNFPKEAEWLQALTQYLQTARLRGLIGRSWQEVLQQVQSHSIDLLLICWTEPTPPSIAPQMLSALSKLEDIPPILVLDHRHSSKAQLASTEPLPAILQQLATQVLPSSLSMAELLEQIQYFLAKA